MERKHEITDKIFDAPNLPLKSGFFVPPKEPLMGMPLFELFKLYINPRRTVRSDAGSRLEWNSGGMLYLCLWGEQLWCMSRKLFGKCAGNINDIIIVQ